MISDVEVYSYWWELGRWQEASLKERLQIWDQQLDKVFLVTGVISLKPWKKSWRKTSKVKEQVARKSIKDVFGKYFSYKLLILWLYWENNKQVLVEWSQKMKSVLYLKEELVKRFSCGRCFVFLLVFGFGQQIMHDTGICANGLHNVQTHDEFCWP